MFRQEHSVMERVVKQEASLENCAQPPLLPSTACLHLYASRARAAVSKWAGNYLMHLQQLLLRRLRRACRQRSL